MRRETDLSLIFNSLRSGPKTFTQLLQATRLPRKTLCLRLKELVHSEAIVNDGGYRLNGALSSDLRRKMNMNRSFQFSRKNVLLTLLILCMGILLAQAYGQYMYAPPSLPPSSPLTPIITETFKVNIMIYDVTDLCAWQARVVFDPNALIVTNVVEGALLQGEENSRPTIFIVNAHIVEGIFTNDVSDPFTIINDQETKTNSVFLGCCLIGNSCGADGNGVLATITFGVIGQGSRELQLEDALVLDGSVSEIQGYTLALEVQQG